MMRRFFGICGALTAVTLVSGSCIDDPLADLDGAPASVVIDFALLVQGIGDQDTVTARVVDGRFTPLQVPITYTACDADIAVSTNASYEPVPPTSVSFVVRALTSGASCVVVSGGGVQDTLSVGVLPTGFGGTVTPAAPRLGDTVTINSTSELKFDTATVSVQFGGGALGFIASKTPDQLKVLVPASTGSALVINGIDVTYVPDLVVSLVSSTTVTQTGDRWGTGDVDYATAPVIATPAAAATSYRMVTDFGAANGPNCAEFGPAYPAGSIPPGHCVIYRFDLTAPTALRFSTDWNTTSDVDVYVCDNTGLAGCFESGGSGAGSSKPENINPFTYPAGTHYFVIELFGPPGTTLPTNMYVTITRP